MIEANLTWKKEDLWDFVKFFSMKKSKVQRVLMGMFVAIVFLVLISGIVVFSVTGSMTYLSVFGVVALMMAIYVLLFYFTMRSMVKELEKVNKDNNDLCICLSKETIMLKKGGAPYGIIEWGNISEIYVQDNASYLISKDNALLLVSYGDIITGTKEELCTFLEEKVKTLPPPEKKKRSKNEKQD